MRFLSCLFSLVLLAVFVTNADAQLRRGKVSQCANGQCEVTSVTVAKALPSVPEFLESQSKTLNTVTTVNIAAHEYTVSTTSGHPVFFSRAHNVVYRVFHPFQGRLMSRFSCGG